MTRASKGIAAVLAVGLTLEAGGTSALAEERSSAEPAHPTPNAEAAAKAAFAEGSDAFRFGHYSEAIQHYEDAYRLSHKVEMLFNLALSNRKAYTIEQRPEYLRRALDIYTQFLRLTQDSEERKVARQNIAEVTGELAALDERERLQRLRAGSDPAQLQAGMRLAAEGRPTEALGQLEALLQRGGNPPFILQDVYRLEGEIAGQAGQRSVSTAAYEKLLALSPGFELPKAASAHGRASFETARAFWAEHGTFVISPVVPPAAEPDQPLVVPLLVENDALSMLARLTLYYRRAGAVRYSSVSRPGAGDIDIPGLSLPAEDSEYRMEYFIVAADAHGNLLTTVGSEAAPLSFPVLSPEQVAKLNRRPTPWFASVWFWTTASVVVAGGVALAVAAATGQFSSGAPSTSYNSPPLNINARPR